MGRGGDGKWKDLDGEASLSEDAASLDMSSNRKTWLAQSEDGSLNDSCLWGRSPMTAAVASRVRQSKDVVWVDLGAGPTGTGVDNVELMFEYLPRSHFKDIYVVNSCQELCQNAKELVEENGWDNVHVMNVDAGDFILTGKANLITFSYSLSLTPAFHNVVDQVLGYLAPGGYVGVADFYVPGRYDLPLRHLPWLRRVFWRCVFDASNLDAGPERRNYLDYRLERVWELNSEGALPYVPFLRAPWYAWVGRKQNDGNGAGHFEALVEAPPMFPPTFLYTMSWEDPDVDMKVLQIGKDDVCLTLTSGGCNSLNLLLHGAKEVFSVDCNPAQSALLEMKAIAIKELDFEDMWLMFGEGKHPNIAELYKRHLAPNMSQKSITFWNKKLYHFRRGLYYAGGMGKACLVLQWLLWIMGMSGTVQQLTHAQTLEEQRLVWDNVWLVRLFRMGPKVIVWFVSNFLSLVFLNRFCRWFLCGVPKQQYKLIVDDGISIGHYVARTFDGVGRHSHLRNDNYFYFNCLTGHYMKDNCPAYLKEENFNALKAGPVENLHVMSGSFNDELKARKYNKVILMDHVDWMDTKQASEVANLLKEQVVPGGRVIWRSAGYCPGYASLIGEAGFEVRCIQRADRPGCFYMDRVNMYNSFYLAIRRKDRE